jgi:hypothetical protein
MPEKKCGCSTWMDNVHGVWMCCHCDRDCDASKPCGLCVKHSSATNLKYNEAARNDKPEPPAKPADG